MKNLIYILFFLFLQHLSAQTPRQVLDLIPGTVTTLGAQPIEALNPATPIPAYQAASTPTSYDPSTTTEFGIQALNAAHTLPGDVKEVDLEEITPATWRWLHLSYTKPDGSTAQVYLRRPLWWMQQHGARAPGDHITLLMPEMGIVGRARLEAILPSTLDTRSWDYRAQGDYAHYPLTGFFAHESAEVWDLYFTSSKQPVGATYNHPFYSTDRAQYVYAGELALGEHILTQSGDTVQFLIKRPHAGLSTKVYNLEVWRAHNFLVTGKGMVVHNNGCMVEVMLTDPLTCLIENYRERISRIANRFGRPEAFEQLLKTLASAGEDGLKLLQRIESGVFENVEGYTQLLNNAKADLQSVRSVNQALNNAEELISKDISVSDLRFEHNTGTGLHDVDLGIKNPNIPDAYLVAYQFKYLEGKLNATKIQGAAKQLIEVNSEKKILGFICDPETTIDDILNPSIIKEMRYQAKLTFPDKGAGIHEFHFHLSDGTKIVKTVADL
ncbi:Hint domain-containing protein [Haliscomenobacter sp.]|uniref:Hint domain-containing protein n=1 Tax=Haliscomenobacter sp. TaxID=2717303 RepID=UPI003593411E